MERDGIDVLLLGREANARTVVGRVPALARGHARVLARLRRRAPQRARCTCSPTPTRSFRGLPRRAPLRRHVEPREAARLARGDRRAARRAHASRVDGMTPWRVRTARASCCPTPSSSTPARSSPSCGTIRSREKIAGVATPRPGRVQRARGDGRVPARRRPPRACCAACAPSGSRRSASRRPRSRRSPRRSTAARRRGCRPSARPRRRRTASCCAPVRSATAGKRRSRAPTSSATPSVEQPAPDGLGRARRASCRPGTDVGQLRDLEAVVYGVGRGVEPWPDDLRARSRHGVRDRAARDGRRLHQDVVHITDDRAAQSSPPTSDRPAAERWQGSAGWIWLTAALDDLHAARLDARRGRSRRLPTRGSRGPRSSSLRRSSWR